MNVLSGVTVSFFGVSYATSYPSMYCTTDSSYVNGMDGYHNNIKSDRFLNGMDSNHENHYEDREFMWRYCRPSSDSTPIEGTQSLSQTPYDDEWTRSCATINGGNAAMVGAYSTHSNYYEDRLWTWYCGKLDSSFSLTDCGWSGIVNDWDEDVNFECTNNGLIRSIWSDHDDYYEDRKWNFECCRVADSGCHNCAVENGEVASDGLETKPANDSGPFFLEKLSTGAVIAISLVICVAITALLAALCVRCRKRKFVAVPTNDDVEEDVEEVEHADVMDGLDEETAFSDEMVSVVEGTETQRGPSLLQA